MHAPARACGIDFGTSNSTVGWLRPAAPALLALEGGRPTLPSAVFFNADEDSTHFGRDALAQYLEGYEGRLMRALKSLLGSSLIDGQTEVQGRALRFRDLLASFIGELKQRAEAQAGRGFEQAVFGRPVHFVDDDAAADRKAQDTLEAIARQIGFRDVSFQFEPIGAALHYERSLTGEELVLVADIGGGTADFSLVRLSPERACHDERRDDLLGNAGIHIGGTDFDRALNLDCVMPLLGYRGLMKNGAHIPASLYFQLSTWHTINMAYTRQAWAGLQDIYRDAAARTELDRLARLVSQREGHWLALQVEQAKIALSSAPDAQLDLGRLEEGLRHTITVADFVAATAALVERVGGCVAQLLGDAGLRRDHIDTVYFTGGASAVPQLRARIAAELPAARSVEGDLYGSIGTGLAVEAARRYG
ncbi:Hsp70 family protein [Thauera linaloolentis]|uniref:Chaperon protein n=1 Tax=Thauera linaloolentis (strain DSM 12138 / JCM 21573 / CCUG 41526 / CIP 105981 / IAM 15112 / NBRC 102519 / 47Lol) TaxID=1123367 RepID=N6YQR2_THAL4|nr:Hsp70 family protein [Thauera linaloolentis]ENO84568.1 chaperon protein [Thauera linaloolentis 47Lol = DSM 12138]MCM8563975.1 Hsp70 family protein [Thauera linaloolentis]